MAIPCIQQGESVDCCGSESIQAVNDRRQRRILTVVLLINVLMFLAELGAGWWADSRALIADSADNLGDALAYLLSLAVVGHSLRRRSGAAFVKGLLQLVFALAVVASIIHGLLTAPQPAGPVMMGVAAAALAGNLVCFGLLLRYRHADINMRSIWLCSRNDVIGNLAVIVSGGMVMLLHAWWPDILVAAVVAAIFLQTSISVLTESVREWRRAEPDGTSTVRESTAGQ